MKKQKTLTQEIVFSAVIAALYAALTYVAASIGLGYGQVQFRFSEALTILPIFTPNAIIGLTVGCFLGNLGSPYGMIDIVFGTFATFIAAILTRIFRKIVILGIPVVSVLMPVIINAVIIGVEITMFTEVPTLWVFITAFITVGFGQLLVLCILGIPLYLYIKKAKLTKYFI